MDPFLTRLRARGVACLLVVTDAVKSCAEPEAHEAERVR